MTNDQSREQLVAELAALRLRIQALEARGKPRQDSDRPTPPSAAERLLSDSSDAVLGVDQQGQVIFFNSAATALTGWPLDDVLGRPITELLRTQRANGRHPINVVLKQGTTEHHERLALLAKDDERLEVRLSAAPLIVDGGIAGAVATLATVDEGKQQQPTELSLAQFDALLDVASVDSADDRVPFQQVAERMLDPLIAAAGADRAVLMITEIPDGTPGTLLLEAPEGSFPPGPEKPPRARKSPKKQSLVPTLKVPEIGEAGIASMINLPLAVEDRTVGMLALVSSKPNHFTEARVRMLTAAVDRLIVAYERRSWASESERLVESEETMYAVVRILSGPGDFKQKANGLLGLASGVAGGAKAALLAPDRVGGPLQWLAGGPSGPLDPADAAHSVASHVQAHKSAIALADVSGDRVIQTIDSSARSAVAAPVMSNERLIGVLVAPCSSTRPHPPSELRLITAIGSALGTLVTSAKLNEQVSSSLDAEYERLDAVRSAAEQMSILSPDNALQHLVDEAREAAGARYGGVAVWSKTGNLKTVVGSGWPEDPATPVVDSPYLHDVLGLMRFALVQEKKNAVRVADSPFASTADADRPAIASLLGLPFRTSEGGLGGFFLVDKLSEASFSTEDERLLGLFTAMASVMLDNIYLYTEQGRQRSVLEAVHGSMAEGLITLNHEGQVLSCNDAAVELLDATHAQLARKSLRAWILRSMDRFETDHAAHTWADAIESLTPVAVELVLAGPPRKDLAVQLFPISKDEEEPMMGVLLRDVTEEREYGRRRDTFVSVASHELRTPMTTVLGFTELLMGGKSTAERQADWLRHIYDDSRKVIEIVDELLDVSKIQTGNLSMEIRPLRVAELLDDAVQKLTRLSEAHTLELEIPAALPLVAADESKLHQVATNLISNAVKYSPKGGSVRIAARHEPDSDRVVLSVSDDGIGIAPADQERLFNTFQRIRTKETEAIRGTGLGLYIVKSLAESMGCSVWLSSEVGKGSTFYVGIPTYQGIPAQANAEQQ